MDFTIYLYGLIPVALIGFWYLNYAKKAKAAGGAQALFDQQIRKQFGFDDSEALLGYWDAQFYLGPLRADYSPGRAKKAAAALFNVEYVGEGRKFALNDRGRISVAEPAENQSGQLSAFAKAQTLDNIYGYLPLLIVPKDQIFVRDAAEVFANHPEWSKAAKEIAAMAKTSIRQPKAFSLVQVEFKDGSPGWTLWMETTGAQRLIAETNPQ